MLKPTWFIKQLSALVAALVAALTVSCRTGLACTPKLKVVKKHMEAPKKWQVKCSLNPPGDNREAGLTPSDRLVGGGAVARYNGSEKRNRSIRREAVGFHHGDSGFLMPCFSYRFLIKPEVDKIKPHSPASISGWSEMEAVFSLAAAQTTSSMPSMGQAPGGRLACPKQQVKNSSRATAMAGRTSWASMPSYPGKWTREWCF